MRELDAFEQRIVDDVEAFGWFALSVAPLADSDDPAEWFTYTIGLPKSHGWPEIIIFGLGSESSHGLLSDAIAECQNRGEVPRAGLELRDVIKGYPAKFADGAHIADQYFGSASWFARHVAMQAPPARVQLLWPDTDGIFPDHSACADDVRRSQTPLETK